MSEARKPLAALVDRPARHTAHVVANIRRFKWLKLLSRNAQLVDLSERGVKLSFAKDVGAEPTGVFWVEIPALNDNPVQSLTVKARCQWYDAEKQLLGAEIQDVTETEAAWIREMIEALKNLGRQAV